MSERVTWSVTIHLREVTLAAGARDTLVDCPEKLGILEMTRTVGLHFSV